MKCVRARAEGPGASPTCYSPEFIPSLDSRDLRVQVATSRQVTAATFTHRKPLIRINSNALKIRESSFFHVASARTRLLPSHGNACPSHHRNSSRLQHRQDLLQSSSLARLGQQGRRMAAMLAEEGRCGATRSVLDVVTVKD